MSDELMELPKGWFTARLGDCLRLINGRAYLRHELLEKGTPIIRIQNLNGGNNWFYSDLQLPEDKYCDRGDLLFAWSATFGPFIWQGSHSIYHYHIWKVEPFEVINQKFAYHLFQEITQEVKAAAHGVAMPHMTKQGMESWQIPLPPLNEQKRIVAAIEALRERSQKARSVLSVIPELCDKFRQSVLAAAFRGDLTADWREQNPDVKAALEILSELQSTKRKQKNKTNTISSSFDIPFEAPETWEWIILDIICEKITDGEHLTPPLAEKGVPLLSAKDVRDWSLDFSNTKFVSSEVAEKSRARCNPEKNDVLVVSRGATVGRTSRVKTEEPFCLMGSVLLFKLNQSIIEPEFIELFFKSPFGARQLTSMSGASAQQAIYIRDMRSFPTPFPPLTEQKEIVRQVKTLFQFIDKIEESHEGTEAYLDRLNQSILAKAFRGELVDQDPNDEPASVLLKRIRVDREQQMQGKIKKPGKKKRTGD